MSPEERIGAYECSLTLAEKLNLVERPKQPLTEKEWQVVKERATNPTGSCPICLVGFKMKQQVLLPCGHCFHKFCFLSFDTFCRAQDQPTLCPLCREKSFDYIQIDSGSKAYISDCVLLIQSFWRGSKERSFLKLKPNSLMQRKKILRKLKALSKATIFRQIRSAENVNQQLEKIDVESVQNLRSTRIGLGQLIGKNDHVNIFEFPERFAMWKEPLKAALDREGSECPICFESLASLDSELLSCSHCIHTNCITSFENFQHDKCLCPVCRQQYVRISMRLLIVSN